MALRILNSLLLTDANLVNYYELNGNANDYTGTANGTPTGMTYPSSPTPFGDGLDVGYFNNTAGNTTASDYIIAAYLSPNAGNFTYYAWVYMTVLSTGSNPLQFLNNESNSATGKPNIYFGYDGNGHFKAAGEDAGAGVFSITSSGITPAINTWYQMALVRSTGNVFNLYVNGTSYGNATQSITLSPGNGGIGFRYNTSYPNAQEAFEGYMADVAMFSRALTTTELGNLYSGSLKTLSVSNSTAVSDTVTVSVITEFNIIASAGANGTISPSGNVVVAKTANQTFTITPNADYLVANVLVDGVSQGVITTYTFTNVQAAHTISATFTLEAVELKCSVSVSGYAYLTSTLETAQQQYAVQPYFNMKIVDDTVSPNAIISTNMAPFSNGSAYTGPDGTVFASGLDASGNACVFHGLNLHNGSWDSTTILDGTGGNFTSVSNRYCVKTSNWVNGGYYVVISYFVGFVNSSANLGQKVFVYYYYPPTQSFVDKGGSITTLVTPAMPNNQYGGGTTPPNLNLAMTLMQPVWSAGNLYIGWFFIASNANSFSGSPASNIGYDVWYAYGTLANIAGLTFTKWNAQYINSNDWTLGADGNGANGATTYSNSGLDSYYLKGIHYLVFSGFQNILEPPNIVGSLQTSNYGIFVTALQQNTQNATTDVWLPPRDLLSSFAISATNRNSFENPTASIINGLVNVVCTAYTVSAQATSTSATISQTTTIATAYVLMQSQDGLNFSYPQTIVFSDGTVFQDVVSGTPQLNGVSYVPQGMYNYLLGSGAIWEFVQNNIVADVTSDIVQYSVQDTAGQPSSINLQVANQNNQWVGATPTRLGASAISGGTKIVLQQGYYNANGVPETVPRSIYYIDDINQSTSSSTNTITIIGRDFRKLMTQTIVRYGYNWFGPYSYVDTFNGTTLSNWQQVSGTWSENTTNQLTASNPLTAYVLIALSGIPALTQASLLQVTWGFSALAGGGTDQELTVYPLYFDSENYVIFGYEGNSAETWYCDVKVNGTQYDVYSGTMAMNATPGAYNIYFLQYDYYKFFIVVSAVSDGNALNWLNGSLSILQDVDFTSYFTSVPSEIPTVALGCYNCVPLFSNFQYIQFNHSQNLQELLRALAVKAGIFNFDFQDTWIESFYNPALYTPTPTIQNRILEVSGTPSSSGFAFNTTTQMTDGEVQFTANVQAQPGTSPATLGFNFQFRVDSYTSPQNYYALTVQEAGGNTQVFFQRYYSGTLSPFAGFDINSTGSLNFDITQQHQYRIVFVGNLFYAFVDGVMVTAIYDNNTTTAALTAEGYIAYVANANCNLYIYKANAPAFFKQNETFALNPADDISDAVTSLLQSASMNVAWIFSNIIGWFQALYLHATDASTYTYQDQLSAQGVDNSDKEYISQVTVYGTGVSAVATNTMLMAGVPTREAVVVDLTITTLADAQSAANNYILNQNQYQNQYSPSQTMNVGSQLFDVVTIVDTGNNTSGVNGPTRIYAETFTVGGGAQTANTIQIETGNT